MDEKKSISRVEEHSEDGSDICTDFDFDDEIKHDINSLLNSLEFEEDSSDEEDEPLKEKAEENTRGDSVERKLEALFDAGQDPKQDGSKETVSSKDTGLENISDNDFDGPESGECDTSDGELPDSPSMVVTLPDTPHVHTLKIQGTDEVSLDEDSDVEILTKPDREVIVVGRSAPDKSKPKDKKVKDSSKGKGSEKVKNKDKNKKKNETKDEDVKRALKLKKYLARLDQYREKCLEYMNQISRKCDFVKKSEKSKMKSEAVKIRNEISDDARLKSVVEKVTNERETSPHSSASSKLDHGSHSSHSSRLDRVSHSSTTEEVLKISSSSEKERKSSKKSRSKSKELKKLKENQIEYQRYLESERDKYFKEKMRVLEKHKNKSKRKHRKSKSRSPDKTISLDKKEHRPPILSFAEFCNSRELSSPEKETLKKPHSTIDNDDSLRKTERTTSIESITTTPTLRSDHVDHVDDDKELFITYSEIIEQDKIEENKKLEKDRENIENILERDPELKSISVFTSVLFKGSADSSGIPFLQEDQSPSPKLEEIPKPKSTFTQQSTGPDEIYDWNDDLSTISQSSLSPSRSPVPKIHNKALLNFLENQKQNHEKRKPRTSPAKNLKQSRSRSKSPKKERSKLKKRKSKHRSSISISPSPPPLKAKSPDYKKRRSPTAHLKERWKDYPSPSDRRREHYDRPSRSRKRSRSRTRHRHRSRSSSEERHYHRYRSRSRSRSRSPTPLTMVQLSGAEKRRKLKEEHERALASLRATIRKPISAEPLSITFKTNGENYETVRDNYDPVLMNEVHVERSYRSSVSEQLLSANGYSYYPASTTCHPYLPSFPSEMIPHYIYNSPYYYL